MRFDKRGTPIKLSALWVALMLTYLVTIFFFLFNLVRLPTYPSAYDKFLIIVGLAFNVLTVWYA